MPILAVDDNAAHCYALSRVLSSEGFSVLHAHTVREAEVLTEAQRPRLILLDVHLPDGNGYEFCRRIKSDPKTAGIKVVIHTATDANWSGKQEAEAAGASAFLTYPITRKNLVAVIRGVLAK